MKCKIGLIVSGILLIASTAMAVPTTVNYQGVLTDSLGAPVTNPTQEMTFYIYDSEIGGSALWAETQLVNVENGNYNLQLGSDQPLTTSIFESNNLWLQVIVAGEPLNVRQQLTSVPFAFKADIAEMAYAVDGSVSGDGSGLTNVPADWSLLTSVPADIADGDDVATTVNGMSGGTITSDLSVAGDISTASTLNFTGGSGYIFTVENLPTTGIYYNAATNEMAWRGSAATRGSIDLDNGDFSVTGDAEIGGNLGIGTNPDPNRRLMLTSVSTYSADIYNLKTIGDTYGLKASATGLGGNYRHGLFGEAAGATVENYGVFGQSLDVNGNYNYGLYGKANGGLRNIGVHGIAEDVASDRNYGLSGYASGGIYNFGVYGYAPVATNSWAGYFDGNVNIAGMIYGDGSNLTNIHASSIDNNVINSAQVIDGSLTVSDLGVDSVGSSQIIDGSITSIDIAANSIGSAGIIDGSLTQEDLGSGSVNSSEITAGAVDNAHLSGGIDPTKVSGTAATLTLGASTQSFDGGTLAINGSNDTVAVGDSTPDGIHKLEVVGNVGADAFKFRNTQIRYLNLSSAAFTPDYKDTNWYNGLYYGYMLTNNNAYLYAPINLPKNSTVDGLDCFYYDDDATNNINISANFIQISNSGLNGTDYGSLNDTTTNALTTIRVKSTTGINMPINPELYKQHLLVYWNPTPSNTPDLRFYGCRIRYLVNSAD